MVTTADREDPQLDDLDDALSGEELDGTHILDAAVDELPGGGVVVVGEGQVLDAVVHGIAQVIAHVRRDPLGQVTLSQVKGGGQETDADQDQRRTDQEGSLPRLSGPGR